MSSATDLNPETAQQLQRYSLALQAAAEAAREQARADLVSEAAKEIAAAARLKHDRARSEMINARADLPDELLSRILAEIAGESGDRPTDAAKHSPWAG